MTRVVVQGPDDYLAARVFMQWNVPAIRDHAPTVAAMTELRELVTEAIAEAWDQGYESGFTDGFVHGLTERHESPPD